MAAPLLGVWPGASPKSAQIGWWVLASLLVIAVGMRAPVRRTLSGFGWAVGAVLVVVFSHLQGIGFTIGWAYQVSLLVVASWFLAERGEFRWIRQTVLGVAWLQVGLAGLELAGMTLYPTAGAWPHGSLTTRTGLAILWMLASLWSTHWSALGFAVLACLTGSWTAAPALVRLVWTTGGITTSLLVSIPVLLGVFARLWWDKLTSRVEVWSSVFWLQAGWLTGWGFLPFPLGFVSTDPTGAIGTLPSLYLNNTALDWVGRTGLVGAVLLGGWLWWVARRLTAPWRVWTALGVGWAMCWQSAEALPVLSLLGLCSVIGIAQED